MQKQLYAGIHVETIHILPHFSVYGLQLLLNFDLSCLLQLVFQSDSISVLPRAMGKYTDDPPVHVHFVIFRCRFDRFRIIIEATRDRATRDRAS